MLITFPSTAIMELNLDDIELLEMNLNVVAKRLPLMFGNFPKEENIIYKHNNM